MLSQRIAVLLKHHHVAITYDPAIAEILAFIGEGKHRALCLPGNDGNRS